MCETCRGTGRTSTIVKEGLLSPRSSADDNDVKVSGRCPDCSKPAVRTNSALSEREP